MNGLRTQSACMKAAIEDAADDLWTGRERAAIQARLHLVAMPPERRAMLEAEWETPAVRSVA